MEFSDMAHGMNETFDAVLAEVEEIAQYAAIHYPEADDALHDRIMQAKARLQSAHEAEVAELLADARRYRWLKEHDNAFLLAEDVIDDQIDAIAATEQVGEREKR